MGRIAFVTDSTAGMPADQVEKYKVSIVPLQVIFGTESFRDGVDLTQKEFFSRLKVLWFAGAALSQSLFDAMQELALATCGERIMFLTGLGATESAPMAIARTWQSSDSTNMGVPVPGVELKLVPNEGKLEARVRGPNITPGYWRQPDLTRDAFDAEGFYQLGDALKFEDPADPAKGLLFDGRVAEDFKLSTGTWVSVGPLRARLLAQLEPLARDVVLVGGDRNEIGSITGDLEYNPDPVEPPAAGSTLICCSQPRDDVVLDL